MTLKLRLLPPLAIARLGSSDVPLDNYTLSDDPDHPLGYRTITPEPSLTIEEATGEITDFACAKTIDFTDEKHRIRPVAPFFEAFREVDGKLEPLREADLPEGARLVWTVELANHKVFRRTNQPKDQVAGKIEISDHARHAIKGYCGNFIAPDKDCIHFGHGQFIKPGPADDPVRSQIRFRFTPGKGLIYGPEGDPVLSDKEKEEPGLKLCIYRKDGPWVGFDADPDAYKDLGFYNETLPPSLYAISSPAPSWLNNNIATSRGYFDDSCDGFVTLKIMDKNGDCLAQSTSRVCAGPPDIAPDAMFLRSLADDLEQVVEGPGLPEDEPAEVTRARALDIVRRAFETVRFMNLTVMNGNDFKGRSALTLDSMPQEESADTERALRPVMPPQTVDTLMITQLHEQVYAALQGGAETWFASLIRRPEEVSDFTDYGRRKMPAMMCGADNGYLALTRRQIDTIERAARLIGVTDAAPKALPSSDAPLPALTARNATARARYRTALINHKAKGNPISSTPVTSVANCCPGLEMDFRAVWRRVFEGITLREYDNLVVTCDRAALKALYGFDGDLTAHRLLAVRMGDEMVEFTAPIVGPAPSDPLNQILLTTDLNPKGRAPLEWSNALAPILRHRQGKTVTCIFTQERSEFHDSYDPPEDGPSPYLEIDFNVRNFFADAGLEPADDDSILIARALAEAGELTQGLCSPWQNDYRECSCYYWASARPDFVNAEISPDGLSSGDNWLQKKRSGNYVPDDYEDTRLIDYDDLFDRWEELLRFQLRGRDVKVPEREPE